MSFDLLLEATDATAHHRVSEVVAGHPVELREASSGRLCVAFAASTTDAVVSRVYAALVGIALAQGYALFDPQAGVQVDLAKPQRFPPGWVPALTFAEARKLTKKGKYSELLAAVGRVVDVSRTDRNGETLLNVVLSDAWDKGAKARSYDGRPFVRVAEDVALALIERGADPMQRSASGAAPIWWAVVTDSERLINVILGRLDPSECKALLAEKMRGGSLLEVARAHKAGRAEKALVKAAV